MSNTLIALPVSVNN